MSISKPFATPAEGPALGEATEATPRYCYSCGAPFKSPSNFCTRCGRKALPEVTEPDETTLLCGNCKTAATSESRFCMKCGRPLPGAPPPGALDEEEDDNADAQPTDAMGSVTTVVASGDRGPAFPLALSGTTAVGRLEGDISIDSDRYMSPTHFEVRGSKGQVIARDLSSLNGTFLRIRKPALIGNKNVLLVGHQLLRVRRVRPSAPKVHQDGTVRRGSAARAAAWALEQLGPDGQVRDVHHIGPAGCTIGRSRGDLRFPMDTFLSAEHTRLEPTDKRLKLADAESANGTWLRLEMPYGLQPDDQLMAGFTIFRFHLPKTWT